MSDFKAKMHQIIFWLGSAPDPLAELTAPPDTLEVAGFNGGLLLRKGEGKEGRGAVPSNFSVDLRPC